ncbi:MAG TPA: sigma 54-interacting transcriptional regulator [Terriglobales bacterium]|nr:sigma 54-interacting transcriptional regulator [Terriglobales bacterium]
MERIMHNNKVREFKEKLELASTSPVNVLFEGEQGVGKEYSARLLYEKRGSIKSFITFDWECEHACQLRLMDDLIRNHLTGIMDRSDKERNTFFFRRIDLMSSQVQEKIIDVLESGARKRGFSKSQLHQLNLVASAERKNGNIIRTGKLSLNTLYGYFPLRIWIPPLRQSKGELLGLMRTILESVNKQYNRNVPGFSIETFSFLLDYNWPNNLDDLRSEMERMVTLTLDGYLIKYYAISEKLIKHKKPATRG